MDEADQEVMMMMGLVVNKGKRTKRQRPYSPLTCTTSLMNTSSSSSDHEGSLEFTDSTEEEEDMANCLILLAQGQGLADHHHHHPKRIIQDGYVYKCKTCNRCFPSFQALGGHRASHKKLKNSSMVEEKMKPLMLLEDDQINQNSPSLSLHLGNRTTSPGNNKSKVHECSICGSEFSSGQALGGHMRRHRPSMPATTSDHHHHQSHQQVIIKKERNNVLSLDLNLPPEDDRESNFSFSAKQLEPPLLFSASALVDCHY